MTTDPFEAAARREHEERAERANASAKAGFRVHLGVYLAVQIMLVATWWLTSNGGKVMPWFIFPLLGWGIGVVAHYLATRRPHAAPR